MLSGAWTGMVVVAPRRDVKGMELPLVVHCVFPMSNTPELSMCQVTVVEGGLG